MVRAGDERLWGAGPLTLAVALGFATGITFADSPCQIVRLQVPYKKDVQKYYFIAFSYGASVYLYT